MKAKRNRRKKKLKYSKPYSKKQYEIMAKMTDWFTEESIKIRNEIHNTFFADNKLRHQEAHND
jgi:hypothetical protein